MTKQNLDETRLRNFAGDMAEMLKYFAETAADLGWVEEEIEARYLLLQLEFRAQKLGGPAKNDVRDAPRASRKIRSSPELTV